MLEEMAKTLNLLFLEAVEQEKLLFLLSLITSIF